MPKILKFVAKSHPLLRETMPEERDFTDPAFLATIEDMCYSILPAQLKVAEAAHDSAAGMAANQWGIKRRVFIYTPDGSAVGNQMEVMINPSYTPYLRPGELKPQRDAAYEGCFSLPLTTGIVYRYCAITAVYYNPAGEKIARVMEGWEARVFQHETDHLDGKLFDGVCDQYPGPDCVDRIIFKNRAEMDDFWKN
jgi:peptide deformylase